MRLSRSRQAGFFALWVGLFLDAPLHAQPAEFCTEMRAVINTANTDFLALRGPLKYPARPGSRIQYYTVSRPLPGADECDISVLPSSSRLVCEWGIADEADLDQQFLRFAGAVRQCFPNVDLFARPERPSQFEPGETSAAVALFHYSDDITITVRKYTRATNSRSRPSVYFSIRHSR